MEPQRQSRESTEALAGDSVSDLSKRFRMQRSRSGSVELGSPVVQDDSVPDSQVLPHIALKITVYRTARPHKLQDFVLYVVVHD